MQPRVLVNLFFMILFCSIIFSKTAIGAVITVCSGGGTCDYTNISAAISNAGSNGTIDIGSGTYTESELSVSKNLTFTGAGAESTIIQPSGTHRIFKINSGYSVSISNLTIQNGTSDNSGGGGILNEGTLILQDCRVKGNTASHTSSDYSWGGGILNTDTMTIERCAITNNTANYAGGGILNKEGTLVLRNSTVSNNSLNNSIAATDSLSGGAGIDNLRLSSGSSNLTIENSTITENTAEYSGAGVYVYGGNSVVTVKNSIIAANTTTNDPSNDCDQESAGIFTSQGYNLVGFGTLTSISSFNKTGDQTGKDPRLAPLVNGTHALLPGSLAIDNGSCGATPETDQRGFIRQWDGDNNGTVACDIGAFEATYVAPPGGVESTTGGSSKLKLWLKADSLTGLSNNDGVAAWADFSGYSNDVAQSNADYTPTYVINALNGLPVVRFDGTDDRLEGTSNFSFGTNDDFSWFIVAKPNATGADKYVFEQGGFAGYFDSNEYPVASYNSTTLTDSNAISTYAIVESIRSGSNANLYTNGTSVDSNSSANVDVSGSDIVVGADSTGIANYFNGDIAELIIFSEGLNEVKRTIVENYLSAKYNIAIANDKYSEQSGFTTDIIGIGRDTGSNEYTSATGGELSITGTTLTDNSYVFAGHNGYTLNCVVNGDFGNGSEFDQRLCRIWYIAASGTEPVTTTLTFSIADSPDTPSGYGLISSSDLSFTSTVMIADSVNTSQKTVTFNVPAAKLLDAYYTMARKDSVPLVVTLASFTATAYNNYVMLNWETSSETNTKGFNILRSESESGDYTNVNAEIIVSKTGGLSGASYSYTDTTVIPGHTYYYRLQEVENDGDKKEHELTTSEKAVKPGEAWMQLDVNEDGSVNLGDVIYLLQLLAGMKN